MTKMLELARVFITASAFLLSSSCLALSFDSKYDAEFIEQTSRWLPPGTDWRLLKAQCYQESRLNPLAESPVGAMGLCQFMPGTWKEFQEQSPRSNPWIAEQSIRAAAWYMAKLHRTWKSERPAMDRYMLAAASYNAGAGHLIKSQRICGGDNLYKQIIPCLPQVTGHHSEETIGYVHNIVRRWYPMMLFGD